MKLRLPFLFLFSTLFILGVPNRIAANDTAASTALGGLRLAREPRISMEKERLTISEKTVRVEYEFFNDTDQDIVTEVAFPIPEYRFEVDDVSRSFDDFQVWVEGKPYEYKTEVTGTVNHTDRSALLKKSGVDIASFGHYDWKKMGSPDVDRLSPEQRSEFVKLGLLDADDNFPQWSVKKTYHWTQKFPAKQLMHISHQYTPVIGFMPVGTGDLNAQIRKQRTRAAIAAQKRDPKGLDHYYIWVGAQIERACVDPSLYRRVDSEARLKNPGADVSAEGTGYLEMLWVDYILTTANSWKTPIKDFELVVERPKPDNDRHWYVSFCWDGQIEQPSGDRFVAHLRNFVPKSELRIAFIGV